LRIWPLYFFAIAIGILIALLIHRRSDVTGLLSYLFFVGNIYCAAFGWLGNPMSPLWSISIEEQFYLVWPWAVRCLSRRGLLRCAVFFIVVANSTLFILARRHATDTAVWANTLVQFEMFAVGILLALAKQRLARGHSPFGFLLVLAGPLLWLLACLLLDSRQPVAGVTAIGSAALMLSYLLIALGCAAILHGFCIIGPSAMPKWAVYLGKISYGLYVYHVLAIELAQAWFDPKRGFPYFAASTLLAFLLTVSAAIVSYDFLEKPFLRLKRRFEIVHSRPI